MGAGAQGRVRAGRDVASRATRPRAGTVRFWDLAVPQPNTLRRSPEGKSCPLRDLAACAIWYSPCLSLQAVDIPRIAPKSRQRYVQGGIAGGGLILITILLASLKPAAPSIDRESLFLAEVKRGDMIRDV